MLHLVVCVCRCVSLTQVLGHGQMAQTLSATQMFYVRYYFHSFKTAKANSCLQPLLEVCLACCIAFHLKHSEGKRDAKSLNVGKTNLYTFKSLTDF